MNDRTDDNFSLDDASSRECLGHPSEVVNDADLTLNEKRAILASWASDACAVEAAPDLRAGPQGSTVRFYDIMEALRMTPPAEPQAGFYALPIDLISTGRIWIERAFLPRSFDLF